MSYQCATEEEGERRRGGEGRTNSMLAIIKKGTKNNTNTNLWLDHMWSMLIILVITS